MSPRGSLLPRWRVWSKRIFTVCDNGRGLMAWSGMLLLPELQVPDRNKDQDR